LKFRTEIEPLSFPFELDIESQILAIGSCFAQVIGNYLDDYKIINTTNPFGVLFNPISVAQNLLDSINQKAISPNLYVLKDGLSVHYDYHSTVAAKNNKDLSLIINQINTATRNKIIKSDLMILTFGTSWVHELNQSKKIVANCHKQAPSQFTKRLITSTEFEVIYNELILTLKKINPGLQILLSVSPVLHSREGLVGNSISKSTLVYFCNLLANKYEHVSYFPGYEIVRDDLRDYRFYQDDLIHPSSFSQKYVLEYFIAQVGSRKLHRHVSNYKKLLNNMNHRPFNMFSTSYLNHLQNTIEQFMAYEFNIDLSNEIAVLEQRIKEVQKAIQS
jgi:hypothetical protein